MSTHKRGGVLVVCAAALALLVRCVVAKKYTVGDGLCSPASWTSYSCDYTTWALQNDFFPGDSLVFNFDPSQSNVAEVSKDDYDSCSSGTVPANPKYVYAKSPATILLSKPGTFYFVSTAGILGCIYSNLAVIVNATTSSSSSPSSPDPTPAEPTTGGDVTTPTDSSTATPSSSDSSSSKSSSPSPPQGSSHMSIIGPLVGSIGSFVIVAKIAMITYWAHRRKQQRLNALAVGPPKHEPAPVLYHHQHPSTVHHQVEVDVHLQGPDNASYGIPVSSYN